MRFLKLLPPSLLYAGIAAALSACSNNDLPEFKTIQSLRVLTVTATSPELDYDGTTFTPATVTFTPWIADPHGAGRALTETAYWCLDPGVGTGATPTCDGNPTRTTVYASQPVAATATFLAPNYVGESTPFNIDFGAAAPATRALISTAFAATSAAARFNGVAILVFYELTPATAPAEKVTGFRRVLLSDPAKTAKNQNPTGLEVRQYLPPSTEITALNASGNMELEAYLPPVADESYLFLDPQGTTRALQERVETTWFLTGPADIKCSIKEECTPDGLFSRTRTRPGELNVYSSPWGSLPAGRGRVLVAVARDGRGGQMVKRYCSDLCP